MILVAGARPNFMKIAPLWFEMDKSRFFFEPILLHTGQHYDYEMSKIFFEDLELPAPHYFLGVGSGTHAEQTARIMVEFEKVLRTEIPDLIIVFGDVNSTLACSITAKKLLVPVAHVEAGLRSFDMTMPEEINRRVTDVLSDLLFTPSRDGDGNLAQEGIRREKIFFVGNIMIDSLVKVIGRITPFEEDRLLGSFGLEKRNYVLITLHRPSNVDDPSHLRKILNALNRLAGKISIVFPVHPRTKKNLNGFSGDFVFNKQLKMVEPLGYREFIILEKNSTFVVTDSGGIQEETTYLGIPCLTLRPNTERPVTMKEGTNELVSLATLDKNCEAILAGNWRRGKRPELWDGRTGPRIVEILKQMGA